MKKLSILISIFCLSINSYGQNDTYGLIQYGHKKSLGMGAPIGVDYHATLIFNNIESIYTYSKDSLEGSHINENIKINKDENNVFLVSKRTNKIGFLNYNNLQTKELKSRDIGFRYVKEKIPSIDWKILKEEKNIGKFKCKKATTTFRGRDYTAWFTTEIPLPFGPWKLQGLPGLILEAYDTNKEIYFYFKSIEYPYTCDYQVKIIPPNPKIENKSWINFQEYKESLIAAYKKSIQNGRMLMQQNEDFVQEKKENQLSMKNSYIETFPIND